jgi:hypothetical protein
LFVELRLESREFGAGARALRIEKKN